MEYTLKSLMTTSCVACDQTVHTITVGYMHTWEESPPDAHTDSSHCSPIRGIVKYYTHKLRTYYQYEPNYYHITQASTHFVEPYTHTSGTGINKNTSS